MIRVMFVDDEKAIRDNLSKPVDEDEMTAILREIKESRQGRPYELTEASNLMVKVEEIKRLYRGGTIAFQQFEDYFLMHLIVLSDGNESNISSDLLKDVLSEAQEKTSYGFIKGRGCVYSYLVKKEVIQNSQNDFAAYANGLVVRLRALKKQCAILIDLIGLQNNQKPFRMEYDLHLYDMMSELFYRTELTSYVLTSYNKFDKLQHLECEEQNLAKIKEGLLVFDWNAIEDSMEQLFHEMSKKRMTMEYVQEIWYRLYYHVIDLYPDMECNKYDFWEIPYFIRFPQWKTNQMEWMKKVYLTCKDKVRQRSLGTMGEAVAWVIKHYHEPITLKQVANHFF